MSPFAQPQIVNLNQLHPACCCASIGGWVEVARASNCCATENIDICCIPNKRYYQVLSASEGQSGTSNPLFKVGNCGIDTGCNFASRRDHNGAGCMTFTSATTGIVRSNYADNCPIFMNTYVVNYACDEKLASTFGVSANTAGECGIPHREECVGKWVNTCCVIDSMRWQANTLNWTAGTEVVVLGWCQCDSHTTNFWEELANVTLACAGDTLDTCTFTAKKYLWIQFYLEASCTSITPDFRFNGDSCTNYAARFQFNGCVDTTQTNQNRWNLGSRRHVYGSIHMINITGNEKMGVGLFTEVQCVGAGVAPCRIELAGKWDETCAQITSVQLINDAAGNYTTNSRIAVWGSN